jgi:hypothetical protein
VSQPIAIDLFCGLGGWTEGLLAEGYRVVGFDIERHRYPAREFSLPNESSKGMGGKNHNGTTLIAAAREQVHGYHRAPLTGGWIEYPAQLVLQDVLTIHGKQFKDAALIVASPPCQEYSYMAMPWTRAKKIAAEYRSGVRDVKQLTALFDACFRIQREASEAAGHHIPMVVENVRGAIPWVGRSRWNFGSFHLWGDVPALMPMVMKRAKKNAGFRFDGSGRSFQSESVDRHIKNTGGSWFNIGSPGQTEVGRNPVHALAGVKGSRGYERTHPAALDWKIPNTSSKSSARKAASAMIAKIPLTLSRHIGKVYHPENA